MRHGSITPSFEDIPLNCNSREIHSRIITLEEYKKYREHYRHSVPYISLTVDSNLKEHNMIAVYDERKNEYYYINKDGVTFSIENTKKPIFSYLVIDLNIYNPSYLTNDDGTNSYAHAPNLVHTKDILLSKISHNNDFAISCNDFDQIIFNYYKTSLYLIDENRNKKILNILMENNIVFKNHYKPSVNQICLWEFQSIEWTYYKDINILISTQPYYTGFNFPIKNDSNFTTLITSVESKTYKQSPVNQLYEKAIKLVSKKNRFENTPIKYIDKLFDIDHYIDEYYDFGANSLKQIYITNNNKHGYDVTFSQYDLKIKIKPAWYNELCKLCEEQFPLNVNLVIDIDEKTDIKNINAILDDSLIYSKWELPSNCMIIIISEYKNLVEKCSNQNSTILKYTDTLFRSTNNTDDEGLYLSINYSKNKKSINKDIRDDFLTIDDEYIVLEAGRESVRIKRDSKALPDIPHEYYEEFYLFPHRKKIEEHVRKKAK